MEFLRLQAGCMVLMLFIGIYYFSAKRKKTIRNSIFTAILLTGFVNTFLDFSFIAVSQRFGTNVVMIDRLYFLSLTLFVALLNLWVINCIKEEPNAHIFIVKDYLTLVPWVLSAIAMLILPMSHELIDEWYVVQGIAPVVGYVVIGFYMLYMFNAVMINIKVITKRTWIVTVVILLFLIATMLAQLFTVGNTIMSVGITLTVFAIYMIAENADLLLIEQLQYEKDRANNANASKSSFIANVSHEIRTPINAILGMNEVIIRESKEEKVVQYAQDISTAAYALYGIINDVLDVSKMDSGKMDIVPVRYRLNQMLYDAIALNRPRIDSKQLEFIVEVNPNIPNGYYGDDIRIKQVLSNLLSNAAKYTHEGFIKLSVDGEYRGDFMNLIFRVKDTGIGIKEEDLDKLFIAFERIEEERNRNIEGTGLGMNITNNLLRMMGSKLKVSSQYGEGSIFSFEINQRIVNPEPVGDFNAFESQQREFTSIGFRAPTVKILVVDDNALNRRVFSSLLNGTEIRVDEANSGYECLDTIKEQQYDLIFLDHLMPVMDGMETLKLMKESKDHLNRKTPVILLTANAFDSIKDLYNEAGFDAYLSKPIFSADLEKLIKAYLPSHKIEARNTEVEDKKKDIDWQSQLPAIRGINWKMALSHLPTKAVLEATLKDFRRSIVSEARILDACAADIDNPESLELFRIKIHAIKSSSAMIGAEVLSEGARELEYAAKDGNIALIKEKYTYMINYYRSFIERLSDFDDGKPTKNNKIDYPQVLALTEMVRLEMNEMNKQNAMEALGEIEVYEYPEDIENEYIKLKMAVEDFDSEKVDKIVERVLDMLRLYRSMEE